MTVAALTAGALMASWGIGVLVGFALGWKGAQKELIHSMKKDPGKWAALLTKTAGEP